MARLEAGLAESHPSTSSVLVDKFYPTTLQCTLDDVDGGAAWLACVILKLINGDRTYAGTVRKSLLGPTQESPGRPALSRSYRHWEGIAGLQKKYNRSLDVRKHINYMITY